MDCLLTQSALGGNRKACGYLVVPVMPATQGCPPSRTERDHQARRRHEAREDGCAPSVRRQVLFDNREVFANGGSGSVGVSG